MNWKHFPLPLTLLLANCAGVQQNLNANMAYKRDMFVCADGRCADGMLVADAAVAGVKKEFKITAKAKMALYTFNTCHRDVSAMDLDKTVAGYFTPASGLEDAPGCGVEFSALDASGGQHSWGFMDFQDPKTVLAHTVLCNGDSVSSRGVSVCQSRKELFQRIQFPVPVVVEGESGCPKLEAQDRMSFQFALGRGKCVYRFREVTGSREARLTTFGHEGILMRKE